MPRGFLKHAKAGVGKKARRGGGSKGRSPHGWTKGTKSRRQRTLMSIAEDDVWDYRDIDLELEDIYLGNDFCYYYGIDDEESDTDGNDSMKVADGLPDEESDYSFVDDAETNNSIGDKTMSEFTLCEEGSSFSIIGSSSIAARSGDSNDEDESYFAISSCDLASLVSSEVPEKEQEDPDRDELQHRKDAQKSCCICLEEKPLIQLMKKCHCHPSACKECLREMYIAQSLDDPHCRYPLQCFWPGCDKPLRDVQVKKFARGHQEMHKYYNFEAQNKNRRAEESRRLNDLVARKRLFPLYDYQTVQNCPHCQHPASIRPYQTFTDEDIQVCCIKCSTMFQVEKLPRSEIVSIFAALGDGLAGYCPSCGNFFVKDGGCDHMRCCCGREFSFLQQRSRFLCLKDWCSI